MTYGITLDLDPDGIMTLIEALTRFHAQCEQERENKQMRPFGSATNAELILRVRASLNRELRRTWRKLPAVKKKRGH